MRPPRKQLRRRPHANKRTNGHVAPRRHVAGPRPIPVQFFWVPQLDTRWSELAMKAAHRAFEGLPGVVTLRFYEQEQGKRIALDIGGVGALARLLIVQQALESEFGAGLDPKVCVATREIHPVE